MERTPLHLAYLNAFYHPLAQKDTPPYQGCIRVTVSNYIHSEAAPTRTTPHPIFRPIYFRFSLERDSPDSFSLDEQALLAENKAPMYFDRKEWSIVELPEPGKAADRNLLEILVGKLAAAAPGLIDKCKSHRRYKLRQRRSFLNHFALPFRQGLEEKAWYGTIDPTPISLVVREGDFDSYHEERRTVPLPEIRFRHDPLSFLR